MDEEVAATRGRDRRWRGFSVSRWRRERLAKDGQTPQRQASGKGVIGRNGLWSPILERLGFGEVQLWIGVDGSEVTYCARHMLSASSSATKTSTVAGVEASSGGSDQSRSHLAA
ncbi:hypothetical protein Droror1_Dr00027056 [Drosera rotundifolia]